MTNFTGYLLCVRDTIVKKRGGEVGYGIMTFIGLCVCLFTLSTGSVKFYLFSLGTSLPFLYGLALAMYGLSGFVPAYNKNLILLLRMGFLVAIGAGIGLVIFLILFMLGNTP